MSITYSHIHFDQNLDEKPYMSAKIAGSKTFTCSFSANCGTAPTCNQVVKSHGLFLRH